MRRASLFQLYFQSFTKCLFSIDYFNGHIGGMGVIKRYKTYINLNLKYNLPKPLDLPFSLSVMIRTDTILPSLNVSKKQ